jgi:hypothetical protein
MNTLPPSSALKNSDYWLPHDGFFLGLFFNSEDGDEMCLLNIKTENYEVAHCEILLILLLLLSQAQIFSSAPVPKHPQSVFFPEQVSYSCTTGKIRVLYSLIFTFYVEEIS